MKAQVKKKLQAKKKVLRASFTLTRIQSRYGIIEKGERRSVPEKKVTEKFRSLEDAKKRVEELNAWADVLDLPDSSLEWIVVRKNGKKVYEQGIDHND